MMDLSICCILFLLIGLAVEPMFASPAAALNCSVTKLPGGLFMYQLSRPPCSPTCLTAWEDENKTSIAHSSTDNISPVVHSFTNEGIILKECRNNMRYTNNGPEGFEEAICTFDCSDHSAEDAHHHNKNSTLICLFGNWCPEPLTLGLGIGGIVLLAVFGAFGVWQLWKRCKRRRDSVAMPASYTAVDEQVKMVGVI